MGDVIKGSEILEVLHQTPEVRHYLFSLYNCQYSDFFTALGKLEDYESRSLLGSALCLLCQGDQGESLRSVAGVISLSHSCLHGRCLRSDRGLYGPGAVQVHCQWEASCKD